jgi:Ni/Co efflux regulator RcnB
MIRKLVVAVALAALAAPALADPGGVPHHGNRHEDREDEDRWERSGGRDLGEAVITAAESTIIREYFGTHRSQVETADLPPGIRKNLGRGKPLPPGIAKRFPDGLRGQLPPRAGYDYRVVGSDVMLVEAATGIITDILRDVLR